MSLDYKTDTQLQKRLHDELAQLVSLPGNNVCCDCGAITPKWASVNLGIFICIRCAGIHRSMGTHISKVRSITLDSWTEDQVDIVRKVGNVNAKNIWENGCSVQKKPDMDQHRLERYIRDKYERKKFYNDAVYKQIMSGSGAPQMNTNYNDNQNEFNQNENTFGDDQFNFDNNQMRQNQSKQLNFMPPSRFGNQNNEQKRMSTGVVDQFDFNQPFGTPSPSHIQQPKSADIFDFGPDIEFQESFDFKQGSTQPKIQTKKVSQQQSPNFFGQPPVAKPSSCPPQDNKGGNVFDFLDSSEVQTMPSNQQRQMNPSSKPAYSPQNVQQNMNQNQGRYQKKSDILFAQQPKQQNTPANYFNSMNGMQPNVNPTYDMTQQKQFDYMSLYQQPQRQQQYQQGGYNQNMYNQQQGMGMSGQRDYSSIGKYYGF